MTDHNDTGATARPWSHDIQHGPNGEEIYAWVYYHNLMVCTMKVHHAKMIVKAVNANDRLTTENAELRRERDEYKRSGRIAIDAGEQLIGLLTGERDAAEARALDAEARVAELSSLLVELVGGFPMSEVLRHAAGKSAYFIVCHPDGQRIYAIRSADVLKAAALAADQKEAGK